MTIDLNEIEQRRLYKQSGAGLMLTIGLPAYWLANPKAIEKGLFIYYPDDLVYASPDKQFFHYFSKKKLKPFIQKMFNHMEQNPHWMKERIAEFEQAIQGFEENGEGLLQAAQQHSAAVMEQTILQYERFLQQDYDYWCPSIFIDAFDPFENEIITFIFREKEKTISKEDLQTLLLPDKSLFWQEKEGLESLRAEKDAKKRIALLIKHAQEYWWMQNDYQHAEKLSVKDFEKRLAEKSEPFFWQNLAEQKKKLYQKYQFDLKTLQRLHQFTEMAFFRDIRKKATQIANYYIVMFFETLAQKMNIPLQNSHFIVPFAEYKSFIHAETAFLKELEKRAQKGVWIVIAPDCKHFDIETQKSQELFRLVESQLTSGNQLYGSSACLGKAIGKAKIVLRQSDFGKFEEGDVLITGMTRPEFAPLMKKAIAIVCDEGGITSHAAIVAREMGKPCVIGTQVATKTFHDGETIEVNANHGIIKKLEGKK